MGLIKSFIIKEIIMVSNTWWILYLDFLDKAEVHAHVGLDVVGNSRLIVDETVDQFFGNRSEQRVRLVLFVGLHRVRNELIPVVQLGKILFIDALDLIHFTKRALAVHRKGLVHGGVDEALITLVHEQVLDLLVGTGQGLLQRFDLAQVALAFDLEGHLVLHGGLVLGNELLVLLLVVDMHGLHLGELLLELLLLLLDPG